MSNVLREIIPLNSFSVKRKFKSSTPSYPNRWWYVIRADEGVLTTLIANWSHIATSNGWSIDYLHRFYDYDDSMSRGCGTLLLELGEVLEAVRQIKDMTQ